MKRMIAIILAIAVASLALPAVGMSAGPEQSGFWPLGTGETHTYNDIPFQMWGYSLNAHKVPGECSPEASTDLPRFKADKIHIIQGCAWAADVTQNTIAGYIEVSYEEGTSETIDLVVGENTAEWSYDRPELQAILGHEKIPPGYSYWTNTDSDYWYWGHNFYVCVDTDPTKTLDSLVLVLEEETYNDRESFGISINAITLEVASTPPKVTGGGWIQGDAEAAKRGQGKITHKGRNKCTFGFNVKYKEGEPWPMGKLQYHDPASQLKLHSVSVLRMVSFDSETTQRSGVLFGGSCTVNKVSGCTFIVYVEDNGKPGAGKDMFWIRVTGPDLSYEASGLLGGGDIQICAIADTIFIDGRVVTMEPDMPKAEALAVWRENILAVGTNEEILDLIGPETQVIELEGRTLLPGFVDPHSHLFNNALNIGSTLEEAQQIGLHRGITTTANMYTTPDFLEQMQAFQQQGKLRIRTSLYLNFNTNCGEIPNELGHWYKDHPPIYDPSQMLRIIGVKIFSDGGSCLRPAFSLDLPPWAVHQGEQGDLFLTVEELTAVLGEVQAAGYQAAIHAIGDRAIETVLDAIEAALDQQPNTYRHRIEHNRLIRPEMLTRYGELGIVAILWRPLTYYLLDPFWYMTGFLQMHGEEVYPWFEPHRSLLDANPGLHVAWHSDWPNIGKSPIYDLHGLITRKQLAADGVTMCEPPDWVAAEAITVEEALRFMTIEAAYALFMEDKIGSLKPGKFADLIVLSDNPLTMPPDSLIDLKVLLTMVGGRVEYRAPSLNPNNTDGSISGHVYQSDGSTPVEGAAVAVFDQALLWCRRWLQCGTAITDENGYYLVSGLPTGIYAVSVRAAEDGYASEWYQDTYYSSARTPVSVTSPEDTPNIDFTLDTGGTISGQVTYLDNGTPTPIANLYVNAVDVYTQQWMASFITDAEGYYTLGLPVGSYIVRAYGPFTGLTYVPEWYDGVYGRNDATPATVTVGQDTPNIDFTLEAGSPL